MNNYPEYVIINNRKYKINTDFRVAIECQEIALNENINDYERALAIIYKLFGDEGIYDYKNYERLLELGKKYLSCNKEVDNKPDGEIDMDFVEDMDYIEASFMSDYKIDLSNTKMHWWKFYKLINGLSNSEMGNCCILNRIRNFRTYDTKNIKDPKEKQKIEEIKKQIALKRNKIHRTRREFTEAEKQNMENFYKEANL